MPSRNRCKTVDFETWHSAICAMIVHIALLLSFQNYETKRRQQVAKGTEDQSVYDEAKNFVTWRGMVVAIEVIAP